jgi:biopolymer transport protein ExbD
MLQRIKRKVPQLNTTSTADISFMLLILFLVTTSMDVDKGLSRQLSPPDNHKQEQQGTDINRKYVLTLTLLPGDKMLCNGESIETSSLRGRVKSFLTTMGKKNIIEMKADRNASYDAYFYMQNEVVAAYNELRNAYAERRFGHSLAECSQEQRDAVCQHLPQRISESNNDDAGGGQ